MFRRQSASSEVVQEVKRFGSKNQYVIDTHGDQIDADRVVAVEDDGKFQFGADPIGT